MNRQLYFNYIEERLSILLTRIEIRGRLNILDLHLHSEDFYLRLLNLLFGWNLKNMNELRTNVEAIDLFDEENNLIVQVSSTSSKKKIENTLSKSTLNSYQHCKIHFVFIVKDASSLRKGDYANPNNLGFEAADCIHDVVSLLSKIKSLDVQKLLDVHSFIKKELGTPPEQLNITSNLAEIINILSSENLEDNISSRTVAAFNVEYKIEHNQLSRAKSIINEFAVHHSRLDAIYREFNKQGNNKSLSVLQKIRSFYLECPDKENGDDIFLYVVSKVHHIIVNSENYKTLPVEELDICINILVTDAFIRCKILKHPDEENHAAS